MGFFSRDRRSEENNNNDGDFNNERRNEERRDYNERRDDERRDYNERRDDERRNNDERRDYNERRDDERRDYNERHDDERRNNDERRDYNERRDDERRYEERRNDNERRDDERRDEERRNDERRDEERRRNDQDNNNNNYNNNNNGNNRPNQNRPNQGGVVPFAATQGQLSHGNYDIGGGNNPSGRRQDNGYDDPSYGGSHETQDLQFMPPPTAGQSWGVQGFTNYQYSQCTGRRKALLIGINYIGQKAQLKGCINDVKNIKEFLKNNYGYQEDDMVVLTDDQSDPRSSPTKQNIIKACQWLVQDAQPDDSLFMHYSGHGGQNPDDDEDEEDGSDEVIYPLDYANVGHLVDDELHELLVKPLPPGARLTVLMDCCHSASVLDLPYRYSTKGTLKEPNLLLDTGKSVLNAFVSYNQGDVSGVMSNVTDGIDRIIRGNKSTELTKKIKTSPADVMMISGCKDNQTSADSFEDGAATGAMSHSFIQVMNNNRNQSYLSLIKNMRDVLASKYEQKPQLSCSHPLDCNLKFIM